LSRPLTATELIRQRASKQRRSADNHANRDVDDSDTTRENKVDLDDEIRRLEEELQRDEDEDDSDASSTSSSESDKRKAIVSLSESKVARIESLPASLLPGIKKRTLKGVDGRDDNIKKKTKKQRTSNESKDASGEQNVSEGLKFAVQEILRGYQPRSAERLPFYCRVCAKQFENEDEFNAHKVEAFHKTAAAMERKASFCKLCRKQLTSPAQLQEHLRSKPHKQRLQSVQSQQQQRRPQQGGPPHQQRRQWS
jgi:uncharacterized CHY-type Zn-finger protein